MSMNIYYRLLCLFAVGFVSIPAEDEWPFYCEIELEFKIMCYYTNWAQYRPGIGKHTVSNVDPCLCTHILFAFANVVNNDIVPIEPNDIDMYKELNDLKPINWDLRNILSVGGDVMGVEPFEKIVLTEGSRLKFAQNTLAYLKLHKFDGIDIDWEFPLEAHRRNFTEMLKELRWVFHDDYERYGGREMEIICALGAQKDIIEKSYDLVGIAQYVDYGNLMTYDLHGGWDPVTGFHSAVKANPKIEGDEYNQDWVVKQYLSRGFPASKITLGIPTYGRSFTLNNRTEHGVGAKAIGHGDPAPQTNTNGTMAFYEICRKPDMEYVYDYDQEVPYEYWFELWVGYDNVQSVQKKKEYAQNMSLGGVMFWDLSMDDFDNQCGGGVYPLLKVFDPSSQASMTKCHNYYIMVICTLLVIHMHNFYRH